MTSPDAAPLDRLLEHRAWVRGLVRSIVLDAARADDVEQQVWLTAIEHGDATIEQPRAWLATVTRNWARREWRGASRRTRREAAVARPEATDADADPVERAEAHRAVVDAVLALPEPLRLAVLLHYFDGLSAADVAARLAVPHETVRSRLRLARGRLRATLGPAHGVAAWSPALLCLAGLPKDFAGAAGAGTASLSTGVIVMTTAQKLAFALVLPAAIGAAWITARVSAASAKDEAPERLAELAARVDRMEKAVAAPRPVRGGDDRALLRRIEAVETRIEEQAHVAAVVADLQKRATTPAPTAATLPYRPVDAQNPDDGTAESLRRIVTNSSLAEAKRLDAFARLRTMPSGFTLDVILAARDIYRSTTSMDSRDAILRDLHKVKDEALLPDVRALFIEGLRDPDEKVRERAARDADEFAADRAVRQALESVRDGDASEAVRARAAKSLEPRTRK